MSDDLDIAALVRGGAFDEATIERLKSVDPAVLRDALAEYLDEDTIEGILRRIRSLTYPVNGPSRGDE